MVYVDCRHLISNISTNKRSPPTRGTKQTEFPSLKGADPGHKIKYQCFSPNSFINCRSSEPSFDRSFPRVWWSCLWTAISTIKKSSPTRWIKRTEILSSRSIESCQNLERSMFFTDLMKKFRFFFFFCNILFAMPSQRSEVQTKVSTTWRSRVAKKFRWVPLMPVRGVSICDQSKILWIAWAAPMQGWSGRPHSLIALTLSVRWSSTLSCNVD